LQLAEPVCGGRHQVELDVVQLQNDGRLRLVNRGGAVASFNEGLLAPTEN
jgi:hypothetical protein